VNIGTGADPVQVLAVQTRRIPNLHKIVRFTRDVDAYLKAIFDPKAVLLIDRRKAEHSPRYRQIIPYVVLRFDDELFTYRRGSTGGEERLTGLLSIGVGGHIEAADLGGGSLWASYLSAMRREVAEEVDIGTDFEDRVVAVINDVSTPVGLVHIGILHEWRLRAPIVLPRESSIIEAGFRSMVEVKEAVTKLEVWSQIALDALTGS
jgi:predicted NUDIX family phosphoesterase